MFIKIKKIFLSLIILGSFIIFASPVFAADCPQGNVAVIGDSLGKGIGDKLASSCSNVKVFAAEGAFTPAIKSQFDNRVNGKGFNTVIVMGGYNDSNAGISADIILNNLRSIYSGAQNEQNKMTVVALTVPALGNGNQSIVGQVNTGINDSSGVKVLDAASTWATTGNVHNGDSYTQTASAIKTQNYSPGQGTGQTPVPDATGTTPTPAPTSPPVTATYERSSSLITGNDACEMWKNAFNLGISLIGVIALAAVIWGGFSYMTSYGNQEKITSAKETIWGAVVGMLIGLFAYVLFSMVNPYVLQCKIQAPFKLSVSQTGTTPGTGQGTTPGSNLVGAQVGDLGKCTKTYNPNSPSSHGYGQIIQDASQRFGVDPFFVESTIAHETGGSWRNDLTSTAGAKTMGQFIPDTFATAAKKWGGEIEPSCLSPVGGQYTPACLKWIAENPKKIPEIVAAEIARIKSEIPSDNYACIAAGYVGGPYEGKVSGGRTYCKGKPVDANTIQYVNNAATGYNKSCQTGQ